MTDIRFHKNDLPDLARSPLLDEQTQEVQDQGVGFSRDRLDRRDLGATVELRVAQELVELGHLPRRLDEVAQVLADLCQAPGLLRGLEERPRVCAMDDAQRPAPAPAKPAPPLLVSSVKPTLMR